MNKPRLISCKLLTLHSDWLASIAGQYFELVCLDTTDHCGQQQWRGHLKFSNIEWQPWDCYYTDCWDKIAVECAAAGRKVVIDLLWEPQLVQQQLAPCYVLQNWNWMWYNESLWYRHLGYNNYCPEPAHTHHALMPMALKKPHRDYIIQVLGKDIDRFIWSYQALGRHLPDDSDPADPNNQRYFNPAWYNSTAMSLIVETSVVLSTGRPLISEKTFKPMAFYHPFVMVAQPGSLEFLHQQGFETFENLFDESYDTVLDWKHRCQAAVAAALNYHAMPWDNITKQKLQHNHCRFFDSTLVAEKIKKEILEPLLNYAETH